MVRSGVLFLGALGGGGWGTSASRPFGVKGVITMKMMSRTSKTSINGVTFISAFWPPPEPPLVIPITFSCRPARPAALLALTVPLLIGEQTQFVDAGGANIIHHIDH